MKILTGFLLPVCCFASPLVPPAFEERNDVSATSSCNAYLVIDQLNGNPWINYATSGSTKWTYKTRNQYESSMILDIQQHTEVCLVSVKPDDLVLEVQADTAGTVWDGYWGASIYVNYTNSYVGGFGGNAFVDYLVGATDSADPVQLTSNMWLNTPYAKLANYETALSHCASTGDSSVCSFVTSKNLPEPTEHYRIDGNTDGPDSYYFLDWRCPSGATRCDAWIVFNQAATIEGASSTGKTCLIAKVAQFDNNQVAQPYKSYPIILDNSHGNQMVKVPLRTDLNQFVSSIQLNPTASRDCLGNIDDNDAWWLQSIEVIYPENPERHSDLMMMDQYDTANPTPQSLIQVGGPGVMDWDPLFIFGACPAGQGSTSGSTCAKLYSSTFNVKCQNVIC